MKITVFGGSNPLPGSPAYAEAYELGKLLALAGHTILTGGYIGTMEAVSRGANEAGGHVIGVTCTDIETWRGVGVNAWVQEERRFATLQERLNRARPGLRGGHRPARRSRHADRDCLDMEPDDCRFDPT